MAIKIKDPNDPTKEIEVYTAEEIEAAKKDAADAAAKVAEGKTNDAIEKYKTENPDRTAEVERLKNDLADATAKLETAEGYNDGDPARKAQIDRLKSERDAAEKKLSDEVGALKTQVATMQQGAVESAKKAALDKYAGEDAETRAKVELEFDKYDQTNTTPEGIEARVKAAAGIVGVDVSAQPGAMDGGAGGDHRGQGNYGGDVPKSATPNALKIGGMLGVSEKDMVEHLAAKNGEGQK